ncbi:hypothetical protein [Streptomyces sp. NRRL S-1896]|nr:hypothetical protein [Streptomyces sp. NRRL S-1896]
MIPYLDGDLVTDPRQQLGPAMALVQLLSEHPELPMASWDVGQHFARLEGTLHGPSALEELSRYADVIGGETETEGEFVTVGVAYRTHRLATRWRDVPVHVRALIKATHHPVPALVSGGAR